ncbi:glycosyl transferase [Capnocytophaga canis]|uniref:glycosyltransferase family 4 protein n=1 Tax=Capnocytophaga canis TaxID=1848903 RepID=UPI001AC8B0A2|nr:glycosyltransferase family 4 protein [Capnocytophaga canis]GIM61835.1 glycosyl transferase [Capnocytophaga canis]
MKNVLFVGELPPKTIHGVSNSNKINLEILSTFFNVFVVEECNPYQEHKKKSFTKLKRIWRLYKKVRNIEKKNRIDFFYISVAVSYFGMLKNLLFLYAFRSEKSSTKIICHVHRGDFELFYNSSFFARKLTRMFINRVDKLIFLSPSLIPSFFKESDKICCLANTIYPEKKYDIIPSKKRNFLYLSNYIKEKGIIDLLAIFVTIDNESLSLKCYGNFTDNLLQKQIKSYDDRRITINDSITEQKFYIINNSDALILPSYNEGQPLVILEAMMCGTIVIASDVGDIKNMMGENYPFLFQKGNREDLRRKIQLFLDTDTDQLNMLASVLQQRYFERYSNEKHKETLIAIFS